MARKRILLFIILFSNFIIFGQTTKAPVAPNTEDIKSIIQSLPRQENISHFKKALLKENDNLSEKGKETELKIANSYIEKIKIAVPKLRKLIKVGTSVFNYPGLLSKGYVSYHEYSKEYEIYIGVYLLTHEGSGPYDMQIFFNQNGIIERVETVVWKK